MFKRFCFLSPAFFLILIPKGTCSANFKGNVKHAQAKAIFTIYWGHLCIRRFVVANVQCRVGKTQSIEIAHPIGAGTPNLQSLERAQNTVSMDSTSVECSLCVVYIYIYIYLWFGLLFIAPFKSSNTSPDWRRVVGRKCTKPIPIDLLWQCSCIACVVVCLMSCSSVCCLWPSLKLI